MVINILDDATNTHDLLIKALMAETGLLGEQMITPNRAATSVAFSYRRISQMIATDWEDKRNILTFDLSAKNKATVKIKKKQDGRLLIFMHTLMKEVSDRGCQSPVTYIERVVYPSITYMVSTNRDVAQLLDQMLSVESNDAIRQFTERQINRVLGIKAVA